MGLMAHLSPSSSRKMQTTKIAIASLLALALVYLSYSDHVFYSSSPAPRLESDHCWARSELAKFPYLSVLESSPFFDARLSSYLEHHKNCMRAAGNLTHVVFARLNISYSQRQKDPQNCRFLIFEGTSQGLGNKLQALVSAFSYAILTNRILLTMDYQALILLCNPFSEAGWYVEYDQGQKMKQVVDLTAMDLSLPSDEWERRLRERPHSIYVPIVYNDSVVMQNFFCEMQQVRLRNVSFLFLSSEQYFLPALYFIPSFRSDLEDLFPDMAVFSHMARFILLPNNMIWDRITRLHALHFSHVNTTIGLQIRTFQPNDTFAHEMVMECLVNISRVLPPPIPFNRLEHVMAHHYWIKGVKEELQYLIRAPTKRKVALLVSSLHDHHASFIKEAYVLGTSNDGTLVSVHSFSSVGEEVHDYVMDQLAFTEIWLLAMSDTLLTSYFSSFGYIASGLSGRKPYLMNIVSAEAKSEATGFEYNTKPVCEVAVSSDPCYHAPPRGRQCAYVPGGDALPEYVESCQDYELGVRIGRSREWK